MIICFLCVKFIYKSRIINFQICITFFFNFAKQTYPKQSAMFSGNYLKELGDL